MRKSAKIAIFVVMIFSFSSGQAQSGLGGLNGFSAESLYCKFHGKGRFRALTTYPLTDRESAGRDTTLRILAQMAARRDLEVFRIKKAECGTLSINRVMRSRMCLLIGEAALTSSPGRYAEPQTGETYSVAEVLARTEGKTLRLPETRGFLGAQSDCKVNAVGEMSLKD